MKIDELSQWRELLHACVLGGAYTAHARCRV